MRTNTKKGVTRTHEGAPAYRISPEQQLKRSVMACMLWEKTFYEDGVDIAQRIADLVPKVKSQSVVNFAIEARNQMKLRHVPLFLIRELARQQHGNFVSHTLPQIIQRPDELTEFLSIYWLGGKTPLSAQVKKGLAKAFTKFDAYQLAKYNRDTNIKLRDVLFLCHAKPKDKEQESCWKLLIDGLLPAPDTWEVALSTGKDKRQTWERLLAEKRLGGMALLRNLRNMKNVNVNEKLIINALDKMDVKRILPFRFIAAARYAPQWESAIEKAMLKSTESLPKLKGRTVILLDVSGSMELELSGKSEMTRIDAASGIGICAREMCDDVACYTFSERLVRVPDRHGFALRDAIEKSQHHSSTYLGRALEELDRKENFDRIIVVTDEQSHDAVSHPKAKGYLINVASYKNGVGYGKWLHIDGFSEAVLNYIAEYEGSFTSE
jgi:60 kDa SS-A/Ro ribonucleoprotein